MENHERYYWLKSHGICVQCGQRDAFSGYTKCPECIEKAEQASRKCWNDEEKRIRYNERGKKRKSELREYRKSHGLCTSCGRPIEKREYFTCKWCREKRNERRRNQRSRTPGEHFRERIQAGVCIYCCGETETGYKLCPNCLEKTRERLKTSRQKSSKQWRKEITSQWMSVKQKSLKNG